MFRYTSKQSNRTTKQAFVIAAMIILICLVCLTGATLALFTSDINDGTIGIVTTSGNVEVDIVDEFGVSLQNESLDFVATGPNQTYEFEPGAIFYTETFQVANTGNIPVNFTISVSKDDNIDMEEFKQAFVVWVVRDNDADYTDATDITAFYGELGVGGVSESYRLVIKMKETVGNEFQGKTYSGIGITVYAVQGNAVFSQGVAPNE